MKNYLYIIFTLYTGICISQPNLSMPLKFGTITYYEDCGKKGVFYKPVPKITLRYKNNKPQIKLYTYEYTGNNLFGDANKVELQYYLEFELVNVGVSNDSIKMLKRYLETKSKATVALIGLPISNMTSKLIINQLNVSNGIDTTCALRNGQLDIKRNDFEDNTKWNNKKFQIRLDDFSYQLLQHAFSNDLQVCSFSYSYSINKCGMSNSIYSKSDMIDTAITFTNSFPIYIESKSANEIIEHIKLDANSNAVLATMEIIDYGFFERTTENIITKKIIIKVSGYSNTAFYQSVDFNEGDFTSFSKYIKFKNRVNIRKPFYYQVVLVDKNENSFETDWIPSTNWFEALDVTAINPKNN